MGIGFYKPEFFAALVFCGALLLIHLLHRPRTVNLKFSTLRFFNIDTVKSAKARKVRQWLLLYTRLLIVILIITFFTGPHQKKNGFANLSDPNASLFIWLDPTPSMDYSDGTLAVGQRAVELIDSITMLLPFAAAIYYYDNESDNFVPDYKRGNTFQSRHGPVALNRILANLKNHPQFNDRSNLLLVSDFQKSVADQVDSLIRDRSCPGNVICVSVAPDSPWNYSVENARFARNGEIEVEILAVGKKLSYGKIGIVEKNIRSVPVTISIENNNFAKVVVPFNWKENSSYNLSLDIMDPLPFDNTSVVHAGPRSKVSTLILGNISNNFVLDAALRATGTEITKTIHLRECGSVSSEELESAQFIIVNTNGEPCPILDRVISAPRTDDLTILYCIGENVTAGDMAIVKKNVSDIDKIGVLKKSTGVFPVMDDITSGLWRGFPERSVRIMQISQYQNPLPGFPLCHLNDGGVLLSSFNDRKNIHWVFCAIPIGITTTNNIWESGFLVPFIDRIAQLSWSRSFGSKIIAGYPVRNPFSDNNKSGNIYDERGKSFPVRGDNSIVFQNPGIYTIVFDKELPQTISVTADTAESRMDCRLPLIGKGVSVNVAVCSPDELLKLLAKKGDSVFFYLPWVLVMFLVGLEVFLWEHNRKTTIIKNDNSEK